MQVDIVNRTDRHQPLDIMVRAVRGLPSMTSASALEGGSRKVDKSTDKLRDHVCDRGGEAVKKFEIFMDVIDGSPITAKR